jgi:hypothetical protein
MLKVIEWYGWIPTNLGRLNFGYIEEKELSKYYGNFSFSRDINSIKIGNLNLRDISDSPKFNIFSKTKEYFPMADIILSKDDDGISGNITLRYEDMISFKVDFTIEQNGKAKFTLTDVEIDNKEKISYDNIIQELKQVFYIVIKTIIHGDSHHHQKIDTAIKISDKNFDEEYILDTMLQHIKNIERNVKITNSCPSQLKQSIAIDEINGYIAYMKTFVNIFEKDNEKELEKKVQIAQNIKTSLEATVKKREKKQNEFDKFKTVLLTIFALFIATNIFSNALYTTELEYFKQDLFGNITRIELFKLSLGFWILIYIGYIKCSLESYMYYSGPRGYKFYKFLLNSARVFIGRLMLFILALIFIFVGLGFMYVG